MNIGRPLEFDPNIALDAAMQLFWRNGYESSSLQQLITSMQLSKSSFYQTFKSKHSLFQNCIKHYEDTLIKGLNDKYNASKNGLDFLETLFEEVTTECIDDDSRIGCLLMNTASEFAQNDPKIANLVSHSIDRFLDVFLKAVKDGQQARVIDSSKDAETLSRYLVSSMSGIKNMVKAGADVHAIRQINSVVLSNLN